MPWYLLSVVSQKESAVSEQLSKNGNTVYYPRRTIWARVRKSQVKKVGANREERHYPLFSGYLFAKAPLLLDTRRRVDGLISFVGIDGIPVQVDDGIVD